MKLTDEAESLMLYQFKDAPRLNGLLRSLIQPLQSIAEDILRLRDGIHNEEVAGHRLDVLGGLVGVSRFGMSDSELIPQIKIRILLNHGQGTPEELLNSLRILLGEDYPLLLAEHKPNDVVWVFLAPLKVSVEMVFTIIKNASPLNLKHHFIDASASNPFRLDATPFSQSQLADFF